MQSQVPYGQPYVVTSGGMSSTMVGGIVLIVVGIVFFIVGALSLLVLRSFLSPFLSIGMVMLLIGVSLLAQGGLSGRRMLPPPPPIQQPMVPAGMQGPVSLNCPNCGGTPGAVDRFGIATCANCQSRFLVR